MSLLTLYTRSFHPMPNFGVGGFGYEGDNRDFSFDVGKTARITNINYIDLVAGKLRKGSTFSHPSRNAVFGMDQNYSDETLQPTGTINGQVDPYNANGDQHALVFLTYRGQNFAMPGMNNPDKPIEIPTASPTGRLGRLELPITPRDVFTTIVPDLDVAMSLDIMVNRTEKTLSFSARMVGDGFPNAESFLMDSNDKPLFCVVHRRIGSASGQLHGNRRIAMASGSAVVAFPGDRFGSPLTSHWAIDYATHSGGPIDLIQQNGSKPSDKGAWNKMHLGHDAKGNRLRRWYSDNEIHLRIEGQRGSSMP
jgi:hypothetical protein